MQLVNLTPHAVVLIAADGTRTTLAPAGLARVSSTPGTLARVEGCPVPIAAPTVFGAVEGLPDPTPGVLYVVSALVAQAARRTDVLSPGTGPNDAAERNAANQVTGVTRLVAWI